MGVTYPPHGVTAEETWRSTAQRPGITLSPGSPNQRLTAFLSSSQLPLLEGVTGLSRQHPLKATIPTFLSV